MTLGALTALRERQVNVPGDLSVVGFDDPLWARHLDPALTVVTQPIVEMAKMATGSVIEIIARLRSGPLGDFAARFDNPAFHRTLQRPITQRSRRQPGSLVLRL